MNFHFYIETSPSAFTMQASDLIEKINEKDSHVFILRQESDYNDEFKEKENVTTIDLGYANFIDVVKDILNSLTQKSTPPIYIHCGTGSAEEIGILLSKLKYPQNKTHIRFYEDDPVSIVTRNTLLALPDEKRQNALSIYAQHLLDYIYTQKTNIITSNGWNPVVTYCFGLIFDCTYYSYNQCHLSEKGLLITSPSNHAIVQHSSNLVQYFESVRNFIDENTLLIVFKSNFSSRDTQANIENILNKIQENKNHQHIKKLMVWGGKKAANTTNNSQTLYLDDAIPLYLLKKKKIIPKYIAGELCTEMFLMADHQIILTLPRIEDMPLEQLTGRFTEFANTRAIALVDNDALLPPDNLRIFRCHASMGDVVFAMGALTALKKQTSEKFVLIANKLFEDMVSVCDAVDYFWPLNAITEGKQKLIDIVRAKNKFHTFDTWAHIVAPKHQSLALLDEFGTQWSEYDLEPRINLSTLDKTGVDTFIHEHNLIKEKTVLIHPNIGSPNRTWTEEGWNAVARHLVEKGWQVVVIGNSKKNAKKRSMMDISTPGTISAVNRFSILESIYFMQNSALLVASDSGPVALAGMTSISIVSIYSQIAAMNRLPFRKGVQGWNALGIDVGCTAYGACGKFVDPDPKAIDSVIFDTWCPNGKTYTCMRGLSGRTIVQLIDHFLQSDDYIPQVANT